MKGLSSVSKPMQATPTDRITFYTVNPVSHVDRDHLYNIAQSRLDILRDIEMKQENKEEIKAESIQGQLQRFNLANKSDVQLDRKKKVKSLDEVEAASKNVFENDQNSHFILKLAFCNSDDLKKWFITQETQLFRFKLEMLTSNDIPNLLKNELNLRYDTLTFSQLNDFMNQYDKSWY